MYIATTPANSHPPPPPPPHHTHTHKYTVHYKTQPWLQSTYCPYCIFAKGTCIYGRAIWILFSKTDYSRWSAWPRMEMYNDIDFNVVHRTHNFQGLYLRVLCQEIGFHLFEVLLVLQFFTEASILKAITCSMTWWFHRRHRASRNLPCDNQVHCCCEIRRLVLQFSPQRPYKFLIRLQLWNFCL